MKKEIILTEKERELIEVIHDLRNSRHNYSYQLEMYLRDIFDELIDEIKY